jgi:hypothetical protein
MRPRHDSSAGPSASEKVHPQKAKLPADKHEAVAEALADLVISCLVRRGLLPAEEEKKKG